MKEIKRQRSIMDENKKKKPAAKLPTDAIICFEDMSNEILYEIFDFLDFCEAYETFVNLNTRLRSLFIHSTLPIKIKLTSVSKTTFYRYRNQIILPNEHRIKSLHLSNPFLIDHLFSSLCNGLKLTQLETLILEKIQSTFLENLLKNLLLLFYLSSLIIDCEDLVDNRKNLYEAIFPLPNLKYCKISINELSQSEPLPLATYQSSPIEHFVLITKDSLYDLPHLLSYMPHLKHLSIQSSNGFSPEQMQQSSSTLLHLTHLSLASPNIPFDLLEFMVRSLFNRVEVFHFSAGSKIDYIDARRWERLISSHMRQLRIFDLNAKFLVNHNQTLADFIPRITKFNSPFWFKRQWFFQFQLYQRQDRSPLHFFSTNPYRRRKYHISARTAIENDMASKKLICNSVRQCEIHDTQGILQCKNSFPNVTDLLISCLFHGASENLCSTSLNTIIPTDRLTKVVLHSYHEDFFWIIELFQHTSNLHTLEIDDVSFRNSSLVALINSAVYQTVSQTNQIRNLIIHRHQICDMSFLVNLCPRLHQLSLPFDNDLQRLLRFLFAKNRHKLNSLYSVRITSVIGEAVIVLKKLIIGEQLLDQRSLETHYDGSNQNMYLWW